MRLAFPIEDASRLARDRDALVAGAARRALRDAFTSATETELCELLWHLAATDADAALEHVVPLLAHASATVRRLAAVSVRSLHPLAALPRICGLAGRGTCADAPFMAEWAAPREAFVAALRGALRDPLAARDRLIGGLAALPGEREIIEPEIAGELGSDAAATFRDAARRAAEHRAPVQIILALTYRCDRSCPYCYALESRDTITGDMDVELAGRALDLAVARGAELVSFTGGEPTCHPRFDELCAMVRGRGLRLYLNTNGLFSPAVRGVLAQGFVQNVGFHVSEPALHRHGEIERIEENLVALRDAGRQVFVRHTLRRTTGNGDVDWLVDFCRRLRVRRLNLGLGFPGRTATNRFVPAEAFGALAPVFARALDRAAAHGIRVRLSKPVPLCFYRRTDWARWQRHHELMSVCTVHERGAVHNLVVNPDGSTYTCIGLPIAAPPLDADGGDATLRARSEGVVRRALSVVQSRCHDCALFALAACQGSCLGHAYEGTWSRAVAPYLEAIA